MTSTGTTIQLRISARRLVKLDAKIAAVVIMTTGTDAYLRKPNDMVTLLDRLELLRNERESVALDHMELNKLVAKERAEQDLKGYWDEQREQTAQAVREQQA